jgi:phospholipid/cholesterol/gamma-HCH transport system ATP-binding protein
MPDAGHAGGQAPRIEQRGAEALRSYTDTMAMSVRGALEDVFAADGAALRRLSYADTSVQFVELDDDCATTLLLDRRPPALLDEPEPAEVTIELTRDQALQFAHGVLPMPAAVIRGEVSYSGPVRRYLEVDVILREMLARTRDQRDVAPGYVPAAAAPDAIEQDLLAVETRGLEKSFGPARVLHGLDLTVPAGVISVVLGPSGTGKSVLLQHLSGLMEPDAGEVLIRSQPLEGMSRSELLSLRRQIGVMFQDGALLSAMTVYENVAFPLRQHTNFDDHVIRAIVEERLNDVGLLDAAERFPSALSGGMRKRAGLARSLVLNPSIVLCDEPDSGLDPVRTALLGDLLVDQHAHYGGTMIVVTHNVALATQIADHMSVVWQGRVLASGLKDELLATESDFIRQFLAGDPIGPLGMDA